MIQSWSLLPCVNFTNILRAAFAPIFLRQKSTNLKCKYKRAARKTFIRKRRESNVGEIENLKTTRYDIVKRYYLKKWSNKFNDKFESKRNVHLALIGSLSILASGLGNFVTEITENSKKHVFFVYLKLLYNML